MRGTQKTFAEELERVLVNSETSVRRLARLSGVPRRTLENWLYGYSTGPRYVDPILEVARALQLQAMDTDKLLLSAGHFTLIRLRQRDELPPDILLEWQLPPDMHRGQQNSALHHAQKLLGQMPWNEEVHREVMELLALSGHRSEALKQFEICKQALRDELGIQPSVETIALYERIRRTSRFSRDNIPAVITPLIGREGELQTISSLLSNPDVRLVNITGLGGIGKTRLALEAAWRHTEGQFRDGVIFVELAALESAEDLNAAIAQAIYLPLDTSDNKQTHQQVLDYLKPKQMLLILDNCEHLLDGMSIVTAILQAAPQTQILITSREYLRLRGEYIFTLQGLNYDAVGTNNPAALLFATAGKRIVPNFVIDDSNATQINHLSRLLDGMPLALELAAAWLDNMPLKAIIDEIEQGLDLLAVDLRDMPVRHRSLPAVLHSTWTRLEPETRQVFNALSVFRGSFTREAAQVVAGVTRQILKQLVAHSLVQFDREGDRYQLHEMLRQFADQKLGSMPPEVIKDVGRLHFVYFNELAQRGGDAMLGGDQVGRMKRLVLELENIRKAIDWAVDNDIQLAADLCLTLHTFWTISGRSQEAVKHYEKLIPYLELLELAKRPWVLAVYARMLQTRGRSRESTVHQEAALSLFQEEGDNNGEAFIYLLRSLKARDHEVIDVSIQLAERGLQYAQVPGADPYYETLLLDSLSDSLTRSGRFKEAEARIEQGYKLCLERDDQMRANGFLSHKFFLLNLLGRRVEARRLGEEYLAASRRLGMLVEEMKAMDHLWTILFCDGDLDEAEAYTIDGLALAREVNHRRILASLDVNMGETLMARGTHKEALPYLREAISLVLEIGNKTRIAYTMESLSRCVWLLDKQNLRAIRSNACAKAWLRESGQLRLPYEIAIYTRTREEMETALGQETIAQVWAEGESLSLEKALEELLQGLLQDHTHSL